MSLIINHKKHKIFKWVTHCQSQDCWTVGLLDFRTGLSTQMTQILQMPADFFNLCKSVKSASSACKIARPVAVGQFVAEDLCWD